jgi:hypothetical protein
MCPVSDRLLKEINEMIKGKISLKFELWNDTMIKSHPFMKHDADRRYYRFMPWVYIMEKARELYPDKKFRVEPDENIKDQKVLNLVWD